MSLLNILNNGLLTGCLFGQTQGVKVGNKLSNFVLQKIFEENLIP